MGDSSVPADRAECCHAWTPLVFHDIVSPNQVEKAHIQQALSQLDGNLTRTARALRIGLSTLKRKIRTYSLR
ncbi:MAG: helix-turn-helix domain-containing protein [Deltaproteobacteria bacterium]|nr:helix-turn-helix domain-containing protein [Deltaproteobacteria bacterium]